MRRRFLAAAAAVACLAGLTTTEARAEPVLDLGDGVGAPDAATDAAGTLHAVWTTTVDGDPLFYCRVPAGGGGCTPTVLTTGTSSLPRIFIRPQDGALIVLTQLGVGDDRATDVFVSTDGGADWRGPIPVGRGTQGFDAASLAPDGSAVDVVGDDPNPSPGGWLYQREPLTGAVETRTVRLGEHPGGSIEISHLADGRPFVTGGFTENRADVRVPPKGADPMTATWAQMGLRGVRQVDGFSLDAGPTGTFLLQHGPALDTGDFVGLWRLGKDGFSLVHTLGALNRPQTEPIGKMATNGSTALDSDGAGRLHAVWSLQSDECGGQECLVYRRTERGGFDPPIVYPLGPDKVGDVPTGIKVSANSGGSGWIVWRALDDRTRAVPLVTPPLGTRVGSLRIGRRRVSLPDFYGCLTPGNTFDARLRVDGRRGRERITSVRFSIDAGTPSKIDGRSPYRADFPLNLPSGTRHVVFAEVTYTVGHRTRHARIGRTFVMC